MAVSEEKHIAMTSSVGNSLQYHSFLHCIINMLRQMASKDIVSAFQVHYLKVETLGDTLNEILSKMLCQCMSSESSCFLCFACHSKFSHYYLASVRPLLT